jgi:uncharacterized protein YgfB (UPF0149 family)
MFDSLRPDTEVFDFQELADHLLDQGLQSSPARIHGCLCGLLAAGAAPERELAPAALAEALDIQVHGELAERVMQLYVASAAALADEAFAFQPLLPDDDTEIGLRAEALGHWCSGFLAGFALVSAGAGKAGDNVLSSDSSEALRDMAAIAETAADEDADEEESENSYFELVEYLRFATLNIFSDSLEAAAAGGAESQPPLH